MRKEVKEVPEMDYSKLIGRIRECGYTQKSLARQIHVSESHFCQKLSGNYPFKQTEIERICDALQISAGEIGLYFFTQKVEKTQLSA